ncbi:MAG TPA: methylated-DNA--[protein]-cysteine S-methyltransferase [Streptosporangiaceae bacterium]|jgi:methylated-DNA-[protein]-cysteine S-methyltransferase
MESTMTLEWASIDTPVGPVSVACGDAGVAEVRFGAPPAGATPAGGAPATPAASTTPATTPSPAARDARRQLAEYFSGQRKEFDLPIDWSGFGPAQRQVLGLLYDDVGYGETVTYGSLAGRAGIPASTDVIPARAVGQIMGSNPIPVIVPCHRVVASDGLGGYSGGAGPEVKRWLLILEGSLPPTLDWVPASPPAD